MDETITILTPELLDELFGGEKNNLPLLDRLFDFEELVKREIYLNSEIGIKDGEDIATLIRRYNIQDDKNGIPPEKRTPIKIFIDSYGGVVSSGMSIIDAILLSKTPVYTIVTGVAYSMAGMILIAGHKRFAYPSSSFLLHDSSISIIGDSSKARDHLDFNKKYESEIIKPFVLKYTSITEEEYEKNIRIEWFMLCKEMLKYGVIDEVSTNV